MSEALKTPLHLSIILKFGGVIVVCIGLVVGVLTTMTYQNKVLLVAELAASKALIVTELTAEQSYGAVRFGKGDALVALFDGIETDANGQVHAAFALDGQGQFLAQATSLSKGDPELLTLAQGALSTGIRQSSENGLLIAEPVINAGTGDVLGVVALGCPCCQSRASCPVRFQHARNGWAGPSSGPAPESHHPADRLHSGQRDRRPHDH